ncbi:MAG: pirin family protein [Gemmatimonadota bacterium]
MSERLAWDPRTHDLGGGFMVRRALPAAACRQVGPFVFFDHFGPVQAGPGDNHDVRPHPHIGLATVTYLFEGAMMHRDSTGAVQRIEPGAINWMTAGRGIVHSERTPPESLARGSRVHGVQTWVALPLEHEDDAPSFEHHPAATLPRVDLPGVGVHVIAGTAFGERSPVGVFSPTLYCSLKLDAAASLTIPSEHAERAVYVVAGLIEIDGQLLTAGQMAVLAGGSDVVVTAKSAARAMLLGGAPVGERQIFWNFVASSTARLDAAKAEWMHYGNVAARHRFGSIAGDTEYIPLPAR